MGGEVGREARFCLVYLALRIYSVWRYLRAL